jgi:hypothetical protein
MMRTEPPPLATWMLEHLIPKDRDEPLSGDLLEEYRAGRSDAWYWRQTLAACGIAWFRDLGARGPLLGFALLWCLAAPAWRALADRIQDGPELARIWQMAGGVWIIPALGVWMALHSAFLWSGIVVYFLLRDWSRKPIGWGRIKRACVLATIFFVPVYAAAFVFANLYWWSLFADAKLASTTLGQITDLGALADLIRIPYLVALACALWKAVPQPMPTADPLAGAAQADSTAPAAPLAQTAKLDPFTVKKFFAFVVCAGLMNAMIAGFLVCRLPEAHSPTLGSILIRAVLYVALGAIAGVGGAWVYWANPSSPFRERPPIPFSRFALACAAGWVWVPCMVILSEQISPATALVATIGAFLLAAGLRTATSAVFGPVERSLRPVETELFAESLYRAPREAHGYAIAICFYAAGFALANRYNLTAATLLGVCAFLFGWKRTFALGQAPDGGNAGGNAFRQGGKRLARIAVPAVLLTVWALLDGVAHRNHLAEVNAALTGSEMAATEAKMDQKKKAASGRGGYVSVILWPLPRKKEIVAPIPEPENYLAPGTRRPLTIPFDGAYWYIQAPNKRPGPEAHEARGNPLAVNIESNNFVALVMDAHQILGSSIRTARCREIEVEFENRDNRSGVIAAAVLLSDAASPKTETLYLGQETIKSTEPERFSVRAVSVSETLRFAVPTGAKLSRFNEITVMLLPDSGHELRGPKIGIRQFRLFPR